MKNKLVTKYQKIKAVDKVKNINKSFPGHQHANTRAKLKMNEVEKILQNFNLIN